MKYLPCVHSQVFILHLSVSLAILGSQHFTLVSNSRIYWQVWVDTGDQTFDHIFAKLSSQKLRSVPPPPAYCRLEVWWVLPNGIISQFTFFDTSGWSQVLRTWDVTNKQTNKTFPRKYYRQFRKGRPVSEKDPNVGCRGNSIDHLVLVPLWPQTEKIEL